MLENRITKLRNEVFGKDLRQIVVNSCLLLYTFSLIAANLFIGKFWHSELHWLGFISGALLWLMFIHKFFLSSATEKKQWAKDNALVLLFFVFGLINWFGSSLAYSVVRAYFVESIYLVLITSYLCDKQFIKQVIFRVFIWINLLMNIAPIAINILAGYQLNNSHFVDSLFAYTYMDTNHATPYSILYSNPNALGIMTTTSILLAIMGYRRKPTLWANIPFAIYLFFSINVVILSESRSSIVALAGAIVVYLATRLLRCRSSYLVAGTLLVVVVANFVMVGLMAFYQNTGIYKLNDTELMLNTKSSDRYVIWKSTYLSFSTRDLILGSGSLSFIEESRYNYLKTYAPYTFSYKDEKLDLRKKYEESLDSGLDKWASYLYHSGFSGVSNIYELLLNKDQYTTAGKAQASAGHDDTSANTPKDPKEEAAERLEMMRTIDTHNGYYSTMFCNGIIGLLIVVFVLLRRILRMEDKEAAYWVLPVVYILLLNCFESALVVDRYTPAVILFMLFAIGDGSRAKLIATK